MIFCVIPESFATVPLVERLDEEPLGRRSVRSKDVEPFVDCETSVLDRVELSLDSLAVVDVVEVLDVAALVNAIGGVVVDGSMHGSVPKFDAMNTCSSFRGSTL